MIRLGGGWDEALAPLFADERYLKIREFLKREYSTHVVYPDMYDLYNCFRFTPLSNVKAVILGQDPYHEPGQAHGLCFSVKPGVPLPPSLQNIYKEIESDLGIVEPRCGDLTKWAQQGVLLLNTTLTVREHMANSHSK
ncbi:MAG: uracil-DNA glycosylase, partial [Clostridia bacterium]|nr:uracil-DNA glycosylase [Clostridia bacterium]